MVATLLLLLVARQATPTDTVKKFIAEFNARDFVGISHMCVGGKEYIAKAFVQSLPKSAIPDLEIVGDVVAKIDGDRAQVTFTLSSSDTKDGKQAHEETDQLKLVSGTWLILPADKASKNQGLLGVVATLMSDPSVHAQALGYAQATLCLSHIKQLALGMFMYLNDYDDKFMKKGTDIHKALYPYLKNRELWLCPVTKKPAYAFNARLYGKLVTDIKYPANTVMFYEGANYKLDFRHQDRAAVGFADGHAKLVSRDGAAKLHWKP